MEKIKSRDIPKTLRARVDVVIYNSLALTVIYVYLTSSSFVPWMDEWRLCEVVGHGDNKTEYILSPHNGHFLILYKLVAIWLIELTHWDGRILLAINLSAWLCAGNLLLHIIRRHVGDTRLRLAAAFLIALPCSYENLGQQFQLQFHLWLVFTCLSALFYEKPQPVWGGLFAICSMLCIAAGVMTTFVAILVSIIYIKKHKKHLPTYEKCANVCVLLLMVLGISAYLLLSRHGATIPLVMPWEYPNEYFTGMMILLGVGVGQTIIPQHAVVVGMVVSPSIGYAIIRSRKGLVPVSVVFTALLVVLLLPMLVTSRLALGLEALAASRYIGLFVIALLPSIWTLDSIGISSPKWRWLAWIPALVSLTAGILTVDLAIKRAGFIENRRATAIQCLATQPVETSLKFCGESLHPNESSSGRGLVVQSCLDALERRWGNWGLIGVRYELSGRVQGP